MAQLFSNNAKSTLLGSISNSTTSISIAAGSEVLFPTIVTPGDFFVITIEDSGVVEIVKVTATSGNIFTVVRGQEGTTARAWNGGTSVELRLTAGGIQKIQADMGTSGVVDLGLGSTVDGNQIWHAGNDGTGSGLDADMLDGLHASAFATTASPAFSGNPTAPTPAVDDNDTSIATTAYVIGQKSATLPVMNGTATLGSETRWAAGNHVHPTDTSRAPTLSPVFTGQVSVPLGSVAGPGIIFTGDGNTGWYSPGPDQISVVAGGVEILTSSATGATANGNLTFSGASRRIIGDFSNATVASRLAFQTSTTNGNTALVAIPNGTGQASVFQLYSNVDTTNSSIAQFGASNSSGLVAIISDKTGSGSYLPMAFYTGGAEAMRISTGRNVLVGTTADFTTYRFQVVGPNDATGFMAKLAGPTKAVRVGEVAAGTYSFIEGVSADASTYQPLAIGGSEVRFTRSGATEVARFASTGNLLVGKTADNGSGLQLGSGKAFSQETGSVTFTYTPTPGAQDGLIGNTSLSGAYWQWNINSTPAMRIAPSTGALLVGTTTDDGSHVAQFGDGTGTKRVKVNGANSGTSAGSLFVAQVGGVAAVAMGNYSAIFGGAYDGRGTIYAPNILALAGGGGVTTPNGAGTQQRNGWQPGVTSFSGSRTATTTDIGNTVVATATGNFTVDSGLGTDGDMIQFVNGSSGNVTLVQGAGVTIQWLKGGSNSTGNRTVALSSAVTLYRISSTLWYLWGNGIT